MKTLRNITALATSLLLVCWCGVGLSQSDIDPKFSRAERLYQEGRESYYDGNYNKAERLFLRSLGAYRRTGDTLHSAFAKTYYKLGDTYRHLRDHEQALAIYRTTELRYHAIPDIDSIIFADILFDKANVYSQMFEPQRAIEAFDEALLVYEKVYGAISEEVGNGNMNIGTDLAKAGMYQLADERFEKAYQIFKSISDSLSENFNRIYANRGVLYRKMGDFERAFEYGNKALEIKLLHYDEKHPSVGKYYRNIGLALVGLDRIEEAIPLYRKCLDNQVKALGNDHPNTAGSYGELAGVLADAGRFAEARKLQLKANRLILGDYPRYHPYVVAGTFNLGRLEEDAGRLEAALWAYEESRKMLLEGPEPQARLLSDTYEQTAIVRLRQSLPDLALAAVDSAIFIATKRETKTTLLQQLDVTPIAQRKWIQGLQDELSSIDLLDIRSEALAMIFSSDSLSIHAIDGLQSAELGALIISQLRGRFPGQQSRSQLRIRAGSLYQRGISLAEALYQSTGEINYLERALQLSDAAKAGLLRDQLLQEEVWQWADLSLEEQETLQQLQSKMQGSKDSEASFAYYAFEQGLRQHNPRYEELSGTHQTLELSKLREELPKGACLLNFHWGDSTINVIAIGKEFENTHTVKRAAALEKSIEQLRNTTISQSQSDLEEYLAAAYYVYQQLLAPVIENKNSINHLIVSPDGPLHGISFVALLTNPNQEGTRAQDWLLRHYTVRYTNAPGFLLNRLSSTADSFAEEWFGVAPNYDASIAPSIEREGLSPLRFNMEEVEQLAVINGGRALLADKASKSEFLNYARGARVLHLATHAVLDDSEPMNSRLFFSRSNQDDALLASEIYAMDLSADMAVLSACATGAGQLQKGEGAMSLERAFQFAGVKAVVATRWLANDRSTSDVLQKFYEHLAQGEKKSVALRAAQLHYLDHADPLTSHPYFWAGFTMSGDDGELLLSPKYNFLKWSLAGVFLIITGLLVIHNVGWSAIGQSRKSADDLAKS